MLAGLSHLKGIVGSSRTSAFLTSSSDRVLPDVTFIKLIPDEALVSVEAFSKCVFVFIHTQLVRASELPSYDESVQDTLIGHASVDVVFRDGVIGTIPGMVPPDIDPPPRY